MIGTQLDWEMQTVNAFISGDPFHGIPLPDWSLVQIGNQGWVAGTINSVKKTKIKNGKNKGAQMAFLNLDTAYGVIDCVVFSETWLKTQDILKFGRNVLVYGEKQKEDNMIVQDADTLENYIIRLKRGKLVG